MTLKTDLYDDPALELLLESLDNHRAAVEEKLKVYGFRNMKVRSGMANNTAYYEWNFSIITSEYEEFLGTVVLKAKDHAFKYNIWITSEDNVYVMDAETNLENAATDIFSGLREIFDQISGDIGA